jgi:hypothetical protein
MIRENRRVQERRRETRHRHRCRRRRDGRSSPHLAVVGAARADVAIRTGARRPVPDPPQHRHGVRRVPAHAPHPERLTFFPRAPASDQRAQRRHSSLPDPPHASQRGAPPPPPQRSAGPPPGLHSAAPADGGEDLLAIATPASIPSPADATAIAVTILRWRGPAGRCFSWRLLGSCAPVLLLAMAFSGSLSLRWRTWSTACA